MNIQIHKTGENTYTINDKEVIEDSEGRICTRVELSPSEEKALWEFILSEKQINQTPESQS